MSRVVPVLVVLAVITLGCSDSSITDAQAADPAQAVVAPAPTATTTPIADVAEDADPPAGEPDVDVPKLLPDQGRWVVVEDWSARPGSGEIDDRDLLQLDVAPLDEDGVPQLNRRISIGYVLAPIEDFDRRWGDAASLGEPINFAVGDGIGRSVHNAQMGFAMAHVWDGGVLLTIQTQDSDADLTELAKSLTRVDEATWATARNGAEGQRMIAVQAEMETVEPVPGPGEPMPHWVLPEPWQLEYVTDMTIWTDEQRAQSAAFKQANQPASARAVTAGEHQLWRYGFADSAEGASTQFVPQITISAAVFAEAPDSYVTIGSEPISALGLDGSISVVGSSSRVELGTGQLRVNVQARGLNETEIREFLDAVEFATDDPLDGFEVSDPRFQLVEVPALDQRPSSWHALWTQPGEPDAAISVWRVDVPDLRAWLQWRGEGLVIPADVWEAVAAGEVIDFGRGTTYDPSTGLLMMLRGHEQSDLIPIALDDWIELVTPVNTDPLNPR